MPKPWSAIHRHGPLRRLVVAIAAIWAPVGSDAAPSPIEAPTTRVELERRVEAVRGRLQQVDVFHVAGEREQWINFPNWPNWNNWVKWNNWPNWVNWLNGR